MTNTIDLELEKVLKALFYICLQMAVSFVILTDLFYCLAVSPGDGTQRVK